MRAIIKGAAGLVGVGVAAFAGTAGLDDNTTRNDAGEIVESGGLGAFVMQVGDCFNLPDPNAEFVESVEGVPCTSAHDAEVYADFDIAGTVYPGEATIGEDADAGCYSSFSGYTGSKWETSTLDFASFTPSQQSWDEGDDRVVTCFVMDYQGQKLNVSVQGSGI